MPHPRIEVLDKATIDKIAAGEVVERPASVMKELLENALDAGATAITAEIRDGGISFLRVTDNGGGIPADQMRTAFLRHATSKLRQADELSSIRSLGFRGEALSSISAVAQVECISKTPDAVTGCRLQIDGGVEKEFEEIGAPSGTTIVVRNLFFNTPARAKFLKTPMTEGSHVSSIVEELALSHPKVSFKYILNGQTKLFTSGNGNLKEIAWQVYGKDLVKEMISVEDSSPLMKISGFIGTPKASRGNRNLESYFVNGRFVRDRILNKAIEDAYHGFLMQHRFPFTLLYLEIDSEKVDVNVHPSKMEIRISSQEEIYHQLCLAIQNALMNREQIPDASPDRYRTPQRRPVPQGAPEPFETARRRQMAQETEGAYRPASSPNLLLKDAPAGQRPSPQNSAHPAQKRPAESDYTQKEMAPSSVGGGKIKSSQEESNLLLSMPPADARAAQGKIVSRADAQPGASPAEPDLNQKEMSSSFANEGENKSSAQENTAGRADAKPGADPAVPDFHAGQGGTVKQGSDAAQNDFVKKDSAIEQNGAAKQDSAAERSDAAKQSSAAEQGAAAKQDTARKQSDSAKAGDDVRKNEQQSLFQEDRILSAQARRMFRLIGQVFGTYWMIEYGQELLLIDQHAAHEKVMYERMMKAYREKKILSQMLFPAIVLNPGREEAEKLQRHLDVFRDLGFEIEEFGGRSFKISAVPSNLYAVATEDLFIEVLGQLEETGRSDSRLIPEKIASMSCKAAVKGDHTMSPAEADALIDELLTLEDPYHCPHGRPAIIKMSRYELDRKFRRIV